MVKSVSRFSLGACAAVLVTGTTLAQTPPAAEVTLTRMECGTSAAPSDVARFSDTFGNEGLKVQLTFSCYLVKHGNDYLVWDAGNAFGPAANSPKTKLADLVTQLGVKPEQVKYIGISHYHGDHIGQADQFKQATLLIGKGDWDALTATPPSMGVNPASVMHWISGGGKAEPVTGDRKDVFGDGTVVVLSMPGHTPGHTSLLVRLKEKGNVLLSGDLAHFHENYDNNGVPTFNANRADTLASLDRFKQIAKNLKATVIIQHDARDIGKLPEYPAAAK
jgi:N-acyl homoserine lactone hydrolase